MVTAGVLLALAGWLGAYIAPADAAIYRCRDAKGETYFTDRGCAARAAPARPSASEPEADPGAPPPVAEAARPEPIPEPSRPVVTAPEPEPPPPVVVATPQFQPARSQIEPAARPEASGVRGEAGALTGAERAAVGAPLEPLLPRKVKAVQWWLIGLGLALLMVTHAWMIAIAFRAGSTAWGVALIVGSPVANFAYLVTHFRKAGWPSLVGIGALAALAWAYVPPTDLIEVSDSYLTTRGSTDLGDRRPRIIFTKKEIVCLKTIIRWDGQLENWWVGRNHRVSWVWMTEGRVRSHHTVQIDFDRTPFVLLGYMPGADLGSGKHRVEVLINDRLFDAREFDVR